MTFPWFPQTNNSISRGFPIHLRWPWDGKPWPVPCSKSHGPSHWGPPLRAMWHPGKASDFAIEKTSQNTPCSRWKETTSTQIGWFSLLYIQLNLWYIYIYNYPLASKVHFQTISPIESIARSICHQQKKTCRNSETLGCSSQIDIMVQWGALKHQKLGKS